MAHQKIPISLSFVCLIGIAISSLRYVQESAQAFVIASWIKPFCTLGFISGLSIHYCYSLRRSRLLSSLRMLLFSAFFFLAGFFINSVFLPDLTGLFPGIHSYILIPAIVSSILMLSLSLTGKISLSPLDKPLESLSAALIPFYIIVSVSAITSFINTDNPKLQWLSRDYMVKPAILHPVELEESKKTEDILYTGPLGISYSMEFIRLYEKISNDISKSSLKEGDAKIINFADFSDYFLFVTSEGDSSSLLVYHHDGRFIKRIDNIHNIYSSETAVAAVDLNGKYVRMFDGSVSETFKISFPPSLYVKKVVFSKELFAVLYSKKETGSESSTFSIIYRLDVGNRIGRIKASDIAPRIRKSGFISVDNKDDGLYLTTLDRNANKNRYLFNSGKFTKAIIHQCGADRFFIKAQEIRDQVIKKEYIRVHDFFRYRKIHESLKSGDNIDTDTGNIIALAGNYFITDSYRLLDNNLKEIFAFERPSDIPFRVIVSPEKTFSFKAEGAVTWIDFSPVLTALSKTVQKKVMLADIKGTLIIKKVFKFTDYFLIMTNNRIFIYDENLQLLKRIDLPRNGHINRVKILNESILLTFYTEDSIAIYSIDPDLNKSQVTVIHSRQGKIWDISEEFIVYGQEFRSSSDPKPLKEYSILIAKGVNSDLLYNRIIIPQLNSTPSVEKSRLILPYLHLTELVELRTGKRTVIEGNISKAVDKPFGVTNSGYALNLLTLDTVPFKFDPSRLGTNIVSGGEWMDLHGYLLNPGAEKVFEVIRSGLSTLGNNSICSTTPAGRKKIINCIDLTTKKISSSFSIDKNYEIVYSDPQIVFMKDNHSIITVETDGSS
jgi:hypothetical protein